MIRKLIVWGITTAIIVLAFFTGLRAEHRYDISTRVKAAMSGDVYSEIIHDLQTNEALVAQPTRAVPCPKPRESFVLVAIGQSNAANFVTQKHSAGPKVFAFYGGRCYKGVDPLPGAAGARGSIWSRLGDKISKIKSKNVIISAIAVGDTSVKQWSPEGILNPVITVRLQQLSNLGLRPDVIIFQQGEHDNAVGTSQQDYERSAVSLLEQLKGYGGVTYVALTSGCGIPNDSIKNAQIRAARKTRVLIGVDMDHYTRRVNVCHFDGRSADQIADEWLSITTTGAVPDARRPPKVELSDRR